MANPLATISTAAVSLGNLILVTPQNTLGYQPQNSGAVTPQGPSLLFNYEGENTATLESDITDHYVEDNTAIQDQIALRPVIITTQGFVGELNNVPPKIFPPALTTLSSKLTGVSAYAPSVSTTALIAYNEAVFAYNTAASVASSAVSTWSSITGAGGESVIGSNGLSAQPNQTQQQIYFQQFYGFWQSRTLFTIQTPWAIFQNMAIKTLRSVQSAETNVISDFEVTFKQMRFASALSVSNGTSQLYTDVSDFASQNQATGLLNPVTNLGTSSLTTNPLSAATATQVIG